MFKSASEARHNVEYAETLRSATIDTLGLEAVQEALGAERSALLSDIAHNMGVVALGSAKAKMYKRYGQAAQNGVYVAPTSQDMAGATLHIPYEKPRLKWVVPGLLEGETDGAQHSILKNLPNVHLITVLNHYSSKDLNGTVAYFAHELVHVQQANSQSQWSDRHNSDIASRVGAEAEAYDVQFKLLNALLDGSLSTVYEASMKGGRLTGNNEDKVLVVPEGINLPDSRSRLTDVEAWTVLHYAHNQLGGYDPSQPDVVPQQLVDIYMSEGGAR